MTFYEWLEENNACKEGLEYAKGKTLEQIWKECHRGDWLCYILDKAGGPWAVPHWKRVHWKIFLEYLPNMAGWPMDTLFHWYRGVIEESPSITEPPAHSRWLTYTWLMSSNAIARNVPYNDVSAMIGKGVE